MADEQESDWSQIQSDLLLTITKTLTIFFDYIHLRAVCRTWRSALPATPRHCFPRQLPWLLLLPLPSTTATFHCNLRRLHHTHHATRRSFYNHLNGKIHSLNLPEASYPRRICGSSNGFLVLVGDTPEIFCQNSITREKLFLSPLSTLPCVVSFSFANVGGEYSVVDPSSNEVYSLDLRQMRDVFIRKVILSHSTMNNGCHGRPVIAMAIIGGHPSATNELVFYKVGKSEGSWKSVPVLGFFAEGVIEYEGLFYAVNKVDDVLVFNVVGNVVSHVVVRTVSAIECDLHYLVKFGEEMLLVSRCLGAEADLVSYCEVYETVRFDVYRFCEEGEGQGRAGWEKVTDLGDWFLFVGENLSLGLLASDFPRCKGNCIYFTDDHSNCNDVGIFDLGNGRIEPLPCYPQDSSLPLQWAPPIWITPDLCWARMIGCKCKCLVNFAYQAIETLQLHYVVCSCG